jgi:hypothetical protein
MAGNAYGWWRRRRLVRTVLLVVALASAGSTALLFSPQAQASDPGTLTANVNGGGDQSGLNTQAVVNGSTGNVISFTYTATTPLAFEFDVLVPTGWTAPQTSDSGQPGYVTLGTCAGTPSLFVVGSRDINVSVGLAAGESCSFTYTGDAPSTGATQTWSAQADTNSISSPQITVLSPDGAGTMGISPTSSRAASAGHTYVLTYTADAGGLSDGTLKVTTPSGFSAPSLTSSDAGWTTSTCGTVGVSGQDITVSGVTLAGGDSCTIAYGDKSDGGPGVTAGTTYGANDFATQEESGGGTLTDIASSPSVFVGVDHFAVTGTGSQTTGSQDITVTAYDAQNNPMGGSYDGDHTIVFSGAGISPDGDHPTVEDKNASPVAFGTATTLTFSSGASTNTATLVDAPQLAHIVATGTGADSGATTTGSDRLAVSVTAGAATRLKLTGATTEPAGSLDAMTLSALDPYGNVDPSYDGDQAITFSGGAGSGSGTQPYVIEKGGDPFPLDQAVTIAFVNGVATGGTGGASADELKIFLPAAVTNIITATDGTLSTAGADRLSVAVTPLTATHFFLAGPANYTAGDTHDITVVALDQYGNQDTSYDSGSGCTALTWSGAGTSPGGNAPTAGGCANNGSDEVAFGQTSYADFSSGEASVPVTLYDWQVAHLSVTDGTISSSSSLQIGVDPAAVQGFVVGGATQPTAGTSEGLTITAADAYGNADPSYTGEHDLTFSGADDAPDGTVPTVTDNTGAPIDIGTAVAVTFDTGVASTGAGTGAGQLHMTLYDAENADIGVTDGTLSGDLNLQVFDAGVDHFAVTGSDSQNAGTSQVITMTAYDTYDNVAASYDGFQSIEVTGASSSPNGTGPTVTGNPGQGSVPFSLGVCASPADADQVNFSSGVGNTNLTLYAAETAHIKVTDCPSGKTTADADAQAVDVSPVSATRFRVTSVPSTVAAGNEFSVTTSAIDDYGNVTTTDRNESYFLSRNGNGTLGGTTTGTILSGDSSDTIDGVTYDTVEHVSLRAGGDLLLSDLSDSIDVLPADGSGSMGVSPAHVLHDSTGNTLTFTFSPAAPMDDGVVSLVVPSDWSPPSTDPSQPGYTTVGCSSCSHAGDVSITGQTITVSNISSDQPIFIVYGDTGGGGPGATAPSTPGSEDWTASSQSTGSSGSLAELDTSPSVEVMRPAADGSGTLEVDPNELTAGDTGNDLTFTYTAPVGGLLNGKVRLAQPILGGWTAFSAGSTQIDGCGGCAVSYPSGNLQLDGVTLDGGDQVTIDLTTDAPTAAGRSGFAAEEAGTAGGTLTALASSPSVTVDPGPLAQYAVTGSSTQTAGISQGITVTAEDQFGNVDSSGPNDVTGDVTLNFDGASTAPDGSTAPIVTDENGADRVFGDDTLVHFAHGVASPGTQLRMALYAAEVADVSVTDGSASSSGSLDLGVTVSPAAATGLSVTGPANWTAGTPQNITLTAYDPFQNVATGFSGEKQIVFAGASHAPDGSSPSMTDDTASPTTEGLVTPIEFSNGVADHTTADGQLALTLPAAESATIYASQSNGAGSLGGLDVTVDPASLHGFLVEKNGGGFVGPQTAGTQFRLQLTALDKFDNPDTSGPNAFSGQVDISSTSACQAGCTTTPHFIGGFLAGIAVSLRQAGSEKITVTEHGGSATGSSNFFDVGPGALDHFLVEKNGGGTIGPQTAGQSFEIQITAKDRFGNSVTSYAGTVDVKSGLHCSSGCTTTGSFSGGQITGVPVTVTGAGFDQIMARDHGGTKAGETNTFRIDPAAASAVKITSGTAPVRGGGNGQKTLAAKLVDQYGNLETGDNATSVTFSQTAGPGRVSGLGATTVTGGVAQLDVTGHRKGSVTIKASAGALTPDTTTFSVTYGALAKLVYVNSGGDLVSGSTRTVSVELEDQSGNPIGSGPTSSAHVAFSKTSGPGTVEGLSSVVSASSGIASVEITGDHAGSVTLKATAGAVTRTLTFDVVHGPLAALAFTSSDANLRSGSTRTLTVALEDANGNLVDSGNGSGAPVTFSKECGCGTVTPLPTTVGASGGIASLQVTGGRAGTFTLKATVDALHATQTLTVVPGPLASLAFTSSAAGLRSGSSRTVTVALHDAAGNLIDSGPASEDTIHFTKVADSGTGTASPLPSSAAASGGIASEQITGVRAGTLTLQANFGAISATQAFTVLAGPLEQVVFTSSDASLRSGDTRTIAVDLEDVNGNLISSGPSSSATVWFSKDGGQGTVGTGTPLPASVTASGGKATAQLTGAHTGAFTLKATAGGASGTQSLTIAPGPLATLEFTSSGADLRSGSTRTVTVALRDADGNLIDSGPGSTATVHLSKAGGSGTGTVTPLPDAVAANGGIATEQVTGVRAGTLTLKAISGGASATQALTVVPGPLASLAFTSSAANLRSGATRTLSVKLEDANGNAITSGPQSSAAVAFSKASGTGTVAPLPAVVDASGGVATEQITGVRAGSITLKATAGPATATQAVTIVPGAPHKLVFLGPSSFIQTQHRALKVAVEDAAGNVVTTPAFEVTFTQTGGSGSVSGVPAKVLSSAGIAKTLVVGGGDGSVTIQATSGLLTAGTITFDVLPF